jgi:hypothetical protein
MTIISGKKKIAIVGLVAAAALAVAPHAAAAQASTSTMAPTNAAAGGTHYYLALGDSLARSTQPNGDRARFAGEDRLVAAQRVRLRERSVGDDLVARGATSAESRSSVRFARIFCTEPIAAFATSTPRKSASCHTPKTSVAAPATARIRLKTVKTLARTMLA